MQEEERRRKIAELIDSYKAGDEDAFVELYMETKDDLERFCRYRFSSLDDEQVKDVLQISFIRIMNNLKGFIKTEKYMSWAFEVVKNTGLNYIRDENRYIHTGTDKGNWVDILQDMTDDSSEVNPYKSAYAMEIRNATISELNRMDPSIKETFCLFYFDHLKMEEIASVQGIKIGTVKSRLSNGRKRLREKLRAFQVDR